MATYLGGRVETVHGDITVLAVDAIVNAANTTLCGGGGVDGAIHSAAGPGLLAECRTLGGAHTGEAKITAGYDLPARHVIHAVGPVWQGGERGEDFQLASCYLKSFDLMVQHDLATVAFPSISTGAYRFPMERATQIALSTTRSALEEAPSIRKVIFCCFSYRDLQVYERLAASVLAS